MPISGPSPTDRPGPDRAAAPPQTGSRRPRRRPAARRLDRGRRAAQRCARRSPGRARHCRLPPVTPPEPLENCSRSSPGTPGPRSQDTDRPRRRAPRSRRSFRRGVWASAFSTRLRTARPSMSPLPRTSTGSARRSPPRSCVCERASGARNAAISVATATRSAVSSSADDKGFELGHFEQLVDQPAHAFDVLAQRPGHLAVLDHVDLGAQDRQRRAQLVRRIGGELALARGTPPRAGRAHG